MDPLCEGGRLRVGVAAGRALDRGVVADRPAVAYGPALLVAPFGRPQSDQLDLARLGRTGLLPAAPSTSAGRTGTPVPSIPRYSVDAGAVAVCSVTERSSAATARPSASAQRSTCRVSTPTPARTANNWLVLAKLTSAAVNPTIRVVAGDSEVPCRPRASSRGQLLLRQASQW